MPTAPPIIHLILPQICGSGVKGARPNVREESKPINILELFF